MHLTFFSIYICVCAFYLAFVSLLLLFFSRFTLTHAHIYSGCLFPYIKTPWATYWIIWIIIWKPVWERWAVLDRKTVNRLSGERDEWQKVSISGGTTSAGMRMREQMGHEDECIVKCHSMTAVSLLQKCRTHLQQRHKTSGSCPYKLYYGGK